MLVRSAGSPAQPEPPGAGAPRPHALVLMEVIDRAIDGRSKQCTLKMGPANSKKYICKFKYVHYVASSLDPFRRREEEAIAHGVQFLS
jgi:hypothetical protein